MTTIIADLRPKKPIMLADNIMTGTSGITYCKKLFRVPEGPNAGHIISGAGAFSPQRLFIQWYMNKAPRDWADTLAAAGIDIDISEEDFECVILQPKGIFTVDRFFLPHRAEGRYYSTGSGATFAIGAMDHGATAIQALNIACGRDPYTSKIGRPLQLMTL